MKHFRPRSLMLVATLCCALAASALFGCSQAAPPDAAARPASDVEAMGSLEAIEDPALEVEPEAAPEPEPEPESEAAPKPEAAEAVVVEQRIAEGDPTAKICYLTLDDGPSDNTLEFLRVFEEKGVLATWFVQGNSAQIDRVVDIAAAGHGIGLHTYSHDYAQVYASDDAYFADLAAVQEAVSSRIGRTSDIVRFPGGTSNTVSANYSSGIMSRLTQSVPAAGYQYFDWNVSSGDASNPPLSAESIVANILDNTGSMQRICVLAHDTNAKGTTLEALPAVIDGLRAQGYTFGVLTRDTPPFQHQAGN
ncbi:polysaccharide deacetylase family protein [Arabiibacter massiliensis]|uniref:polysaccharide deacetylase family protein n=1 Tax=Arabiibacter massiliensis TaxID=1870985 RepID=UPI0009BAE00F|nr:polysaccharide deacetylase family protein [Arabiibacter massiliensis]